MADPNTQIILSAVDRTRQAFDSVNSNFGKMNEIISKVKTTLSVLIAGDAIGHFASSAIEASGEILKFSTILGTSTEGLTALQYAISKTANITKEELNDSLADMRERISEATTGTGDAADALKRLGLDAKALNKLPLEEQFFAIADAMKAVKNQGDQIFTIRQLISDSATPLLDSLNQGSDSLRNFTKEAHEMGVVIDEDSTKKIRDFKKEMDTLKSVADNLGITLVSGVIPYITKFLELIESGVKHIKSFSVAIGLVDENLQALTKKELVDRIDEINKKIAEAQKFVARGGIVGASSGLGIEKLKKDLQELQKELDSRPLEIQITKGQAGIKRVDPLDGYKINPMEIAEETKQLQAAADKIFEYSKSAADRYQEQLKAIHEALISGYLTGGEETAQKAIDKATKEFMESQKKQADEFQKLWGSTIDRFASGMGDAVANVISKQMTAKEALRSVLADITKSVISSLVEIFVKQQIIAKASEALGLTSIATTAAEAGVASAAWAAPAALASLATLGTNSVPASVALGSTVAFSKALSMTGALGISDGGLDFVKNHGTYILEKGEGVIKRQDNEKIPALLNKLNSGVGGQNVNFNVTIQALDTQNAVDVFNSAISNSESTIVSLIQKAYERRGATGGPLR